MSMSPQYSRLPRDMIIEPQDPGRQHGLPEPQPHWPGERAAFWLPGRQSCLVCGVEGFQTFTSACLALLLIVIQCHSFAQNPDQTLPFHYLPLFQNKKVRVWTWNACASHEAVQKAGEWGPRLAFLQIFQQTFQGHGPSCMSHPVQPSLLAATPSPRSHHLHGFPYPFVRNLLFIVPEDSAVHSECLVDTLVQKPGIFQRLAELPWTAWLMVTACIPGQHL